MPDPADRAAAALTIARPASRGSTALRAIVGAVFALSVLAAPQAVSPAPVAAGSSCTGWTSIKNPPRTIKVLNVKTGQVEKVDFRKYVKRVMASGEWPGRLRMATLEAGAIATKQYAWYYALKGNHRSAYVRNGKCYDVRGDTSDQLYKHYATPDARQKKAVDKTWGTSLLKNGRFFLTGYRAGSSATCAADANGWKLFARSVEACANKGWSSHRILRAYLSPNLRFVHAGSVGPDVSRPRIALKVGNSVAGGAATIIWKPQPAGANVARYRLERKVSGGNWKAVDLAKPRIRSTDAWVKLGANTRFRVRAQDGKGVWGPWSYSAKRWASVRGPAGITIAGNVELALSEPRKVKTRFTGRSVALVMRTGPGMGSVKVFVDGRKAAVVDLDRKTANPRRLVFAKNWGKVGSHAISIRPVTDHERVDFNGFFVLR